MNATKTDTLVEQARLKDGEIRQVLIDICGIAILTDSQSEFCYQLNKAQLAKAMWTVVDDLEAAHSQEVLDYRLTLKMDLETAGMKNPREEPNG